MAQYDAADMLLRLQRVIRAATGAAFPGTTDLYAWLLESENDVKIDVSTVCPAALLSINGPQLMTSPDGGYTYTFGTDSDGNLLFPIGHFEIFAQQSDIPQFPLLPYDDFLIEGSQIRMPMNRQITFPNGPYYRGILPTLYLDASHQPTLLPVQARQWVIYEAAVRYGASALRGKDLQTWQTLRDTERMRWITLYQTQYGSSGHVATLRNGNPYVRRPRVQRMFSG